MRKDFKIGNVRIVVCGGTKEVSKAMMIIEENKEKLTGNEPKDRLILQELVDTNKISARILYDGNPILSFDKCISEFKKYNKSGSIENLTDYFYKILNYFGDIAHYDKGGYIYYYNGSFEEVKKKVIFDCRTPCWKTDQARIIKEMKRLDEEKNNHKVSKPKKVNKSKESLNVICEQTTFNLGI